MIGTPSFLTDVLNFVVQNIDLTQLKQNFDYIYY